MEVTVTKKVTMRVDRIRSECGVRYWEDAELNGAQCDEDVKFPSRVGDTWNPTIMLETGKIMEWPEGIIASIHFKVCDDGRYYLLTPEGEVAAMIDGYVPKIMCPGGLGYGDYVIMRIDGDGAIADWNPDLSPFECDED